MKIIVRKIIRPVNPQEPTVECNVEFEASVICNPWELTAQADEENKREREFLNKITGRVETILAKLIAAK